MIRAVLSNYSWPYTEYHHFELDGYGVCRIQYGNLLTNKGDILLCPVSNDFRPSNPLAQHIINVEKDLKAALMNIKETGWIGSEHVAFLPCRKLKYRGILFVSVDFYSENRVEINAKCIAEAFKIAKKYNCRKLACPVNFLYAPLNHSDSYPNIYDLLSQVAIVVNHLNKTDEKIDFIIDIIIKNTFWNHVNYNPGGKFCDFSKAFLELLPKCSEILPWYRKKIRKICRGNALNNRDANNVWEILTDQTIKIKKVVRVEKRLRKVLGDYNESDVDYYPNGGDGFLLQMLKEMPWNYDLINEGFKQFSPCP